MENHGDTIEDVHSLIMEVGLPATLEQIENPTEEFVVNIISEFFRVFFIDVNQIKQLTPEQREALDITSPENADIAHLINLREVMGIIGREIFIKDFQITDITAPRQVRTKKNLKFIVNFVLYARNKKQQMQEKIDEVLSRAEKLQNMHKQNQDMVERMNKQAMVTAQKKAQIEKLKRKIADNGEIISENEMKIIEYDKILQEKMQIKEEKIARDGAKRAEMQKLRAKVDELRAKIVKSPEKIRKQLVELEENRKEQEEKREIIRAAILNKKTLLQDYESASTIIKREYSTLKGIIDDQISLQAMKKKCGRLREDIEDVTRNINLAEKLGSQDHRQASIEAIQECEKQCQERINRLRKTHAEIESEKKLLDRKRENIESRCTEMYSETSKIQGEIAQTEKDIASFLQHCQELYDMEISKLQQFKGIFS